MSRAARYGSSAADMQRSRLIRQRSVRPQVPESSSAGMGFRPPPPSHPRDALPRRARTEILIDPAQLDREAADGVARRDGRARRGAHSAEGGAIAGEAASLRSAAFCGPAPATTSSASTPRSRASVSASRSSDRPFSLASRPIYKSRSGSPGDDPLRGSLAYGAQSMAFGKANTGVEPTNR